MKRVLPVVLLVAFLLVLPVQAQSLPWVEMWVTVRDGVTGVVLEDAQVENPLCEGLPADACTRYGVWNAERQAFILKIPRLEPYEVVVSKDGYETRVRSGTAVDAVTAWDVRLFPAQAGATFRVYLPLIMSSGTPLPPPVYDPVAAVGRLNWWRSLAGLPAVSGNLELHSACRAHARWMVNNGIAAHTEDPELPGYTIEGDACGQAANLAFGVDVFPGDEQAVDAMMASPFHALNALDGRLVEVGFGSARLETVWSGSYSAAALDVFHGQDWSLVPAPTTFPKDNGTLPVLSYNGLAQPDPLTACPGYTAPTGAALLAMYLPYPPGTIASTTLQQGSTLLEHCVIHGWSYHNPNRDLELQGRSALAERGALMIIPRLPLQAGKTYTMRVTWAGGQEVRWTFTTATEPLDILPLRVLLPHGD